MPVKRCKISDFLIGFSCEDGLILEYPIKSSAHG
jgi:hypothetical protein